MAMGTLLVFFTFTHLASCVKPHEQEQDTTKPAVTTAIFCAIRCMSQTTCSRFTLTPKMRLRCLLKGEKGSSKDSHETYTRVNLRHEAVTRSTSPIFLSMYFQKGLEFSSDEPKRRCPCSITVNKQVIELDKLVFDIVPNLYFNPATHRTVNIVKGRTKGYFSLIEAKTCRIHELSTRRNLYISKCVDGSQHAMHQYFRFKLQVRMISLDSNAHLLFILTNKRQIYCVKQGEKGFSYIENHNAIGMGVDSHNSKLYVNLIKSVAVFHYEGCRKKAKRQLELRTDAVRMVLNPIGDKLFYCEHNRVVAYFPQDGRSLNHHLAGLCCKVASVLEDVWVSCFESKNITVLRIQKGSFAVMRHLPF